MIERYYNWMRVEDKLPKGVYIVPTEEGDMPVVHTASGDVILREGDIIPKPGEWSTQPFA